MKTIMRLLSAFDKKTLPAFMVLFLLAVGCSKDQKSAEPQGPINIFTTQFPTGPTQNDNLGGIELGVKFRSLVPGFVDGIRFYKTKGNTGTHTGELYTMAGSLLASKAFTAETDSGWQSVTFDNPVSIDANTTYIAAYHSSLGNYVSFAKGFTTAIVNSPLTGLADGTDGANGLYRYTNSPAVPDSGFIANNYWVDLIFHGK